MGVKTTPGKIEKSKLKGSINDLLDRFIPEGQKVRWHTSESNLSARLIIIHDGIRLTISIQDDEL